MAELKRKQRQLPSRGLNLGSARAPACCFWRPRRKPVGARKLLGLRCAFREGAECCTRGACAPRIYRAHSVSIAAVIGGIAFGFICWTVMMSATEPMINAAAIKVR